MIVTRPCLILCHPMDCSPPGSSVHGIVQARLVEWVAISFSRGIFPTQDVPWPPALQADSLLCELQGSPIYQYCFINYSERRSWHPVPSLHGKYMGKQLKECQTLFFWAPKSPQMVTAAMKLKDAYALEQSYDQPRQHIKKQRHCQQRSV